MKLKSFSRVRLCVTPWTGARSIHGILQARMLEWVAIQGIFLTQGSNLGFLHWQVDSLPSEPLGKTLLK